jgi:hypothetical protein
MDTDAEYRVVSIHKWLFCPISAPALPAQWNALEVIFHRGGMRSLFLWGYAQILILEIFLYIHRGTYFVAPAVKIFACLDLEQNISFLERH